MHLVDIGGIIVAVVAALGAWAAQRASSKASTVNTTVASRLDAEKEAYERARQFDIDTINRQAQDIKDLREQLAQTRERLAVLESTKPISLERLLGERLKEPDGNDTPDQQ